MSDSSAWQRAAAAAGFPTVRVERDGLRGEIARLIAPDDAIERLLADGVELSEALRGLGFSYVAVELGEEPDARA